jgi:hypothetical protein
MTHASEHLDQIRKALDDSWLPQIYRERVLKLRTRAYQFPTLPQNAPVEIHHTLPTARYLSVFARLGCSAVAVPYDITRISLLADEIESSWHRMLLVSDEITSGRSNTFRARVRRQIIAKVREEIDNAGAGPRVPEFNQSTKQRTEPQKSTKGNVEP